MVDAQFARGLCAGLDEVLAPCPVTLDCLEAYFDPRLTPPDFLEWLAAWVGPEPRPELARGTAPGAGSWRRASCTDGRGRSAGSSSTSASTQAFVPEVHDSGGVGWSTTPDARCRGTRSRS